MVWHQGARTLTAPVLISSCCRAASPMATICAPALAWQRFRHRVVGAVGHVAAHYGVAVAGICNGFPEISVRGGMLPGALLLATTASNTSTRPRVSARCDSLPPQAFASHRRLWRRKSADGGDDGGRGEGAISRRSSGHTSARLEGERPGGVSLIVTTPTAKRLREPIARIVSDQRQCPWDHASPRPGLRSGALGSADWRPPVFRACSGPPKEDLETKKGAARCGPPLGERSES